MQGFLIHAGYPALILLAFLEACCIPISSEVIFGFAGVLAFQGHLSLTLVIITGTLAELAGSYVAYAVGRAAERAVIERLGRFLLITRADISRAEHFLAGRGGWAIPAGRVMPLLRSFTSLAAGFAGVPALRFGILSLIGTAIYVAALSCAGFAVGSAWDRVAGDLSVAGYVTAAVVAAVFVAFAIYRLRKLRRESREEASRSGQAVTPVRSGKSRSLSGTVRGYCRSYAVTSLRMKTAIAAAIAATT
jgi:membrane protein DedA with SNARE-associated domain